MYLVATRQIFGVTDDPHLHANHSEVFQTSHKRTVSSQRTVIFRVYVGRLSSKVSKFFFSGMEANRNVKVVGGDVAVL